MITLNQSCNGQECQSPSPKREGRYHSPVEVRLHSLLRHVGEIVLHPAHCRHAMRRRLPSRERVRPCGERRQREQLPRPRPGLGRPQPRDVAGVHADHRRVGSRRRRRRQPGQPPQGRRPPPRPRTAAQHPAGRRPLVIRIVFGRPAGRRFFKNFTLFSVSPRGPSPTGACPR